LAILEAQVRLVLASDGLHLRVFGEAAHVEPAYAAISRRTHDATHQLRTNALVLVGLLHGEGRLGLLAPSVAEAAQLGGGAHAPLDDEAVDHAPELGHAAGVVLDEAVRHGMRKAQASALLVEAQQVIAELARFRRPQLANRALAGRLSGNSFAHALPPCACAMLVARSRASSRACRMIVGSTGEPRLWGISSCIAQSKLDVTTV